MSHQPKILLIDDEIDITSNIAPLLERAGFMVATAGDGEQGRQLISQFKPNLIVLDVLMPSLDGRSLLRQMRQGDNWTPVILLTQVGKSIERALALEEGADDYLNKPFDPFELIARIKAVLRRVRPGERPLTAAHLLQSGELTFDRRSRRAHLNQQPLTLTPKAATLLEYLLTHPNEIFSREQLLDAVWGWDYPAGTRTVDSRIAELRRMLQDDPASPRYIATIPGQGYRFIAPVEVIS